MNQMETIIRKCEQLHELGKMPEIEAIVAGGSVSFEQVDVHSDLDLFILIDSCADISRLRIKARELASHLGDFTLFHGPQFLEGFGYSFLTIYQPFLVVQFLINDRSSLKPNPMQAQETPIVFDRTGYYTQYLIDRKGMKINEIGLFESTFAFFWFRVIRVWKDIKRGHAWLAIRHLSDVRDQLFVLQRLIHNCPPPGLNYLWPSKAIEDNLGQEINAGFLHTMCTYSLRSIAEALIFCMEWFVRDSNRYMNEHNLKYPTEVKAAQGVYEMVCQDLSNVDRSG